MTTAQKQVVGVAIASLVLGILGLIMIGPLGSIPAVICGHVAQSRIRKAPETCSGGGMALAGLILGYIQIAFMVVLIPLMLAVTVPAFSQARDAAQRVVCVNNMRQITAAKEQAATDNHLTAGALLTEEQVEMYVPGGLKALRCPRGGHYTLQPVGQDPECSVHGKMSATVRRR